MIMPGPNDLEDVKAHISENTCAIMLETIQGEGGVVPLEEEFVQGVAAFAKSAAFC